jgi:hypothetical protein
MNKCPFLGCGVIKSDAFFCCTRCWKRMAARERTRAVKLLKLVSSSRISGLEYAVIADAICAEVGKCKSQADR